VTYTWAGDEWGDKDPVTGQWSGLISQVQYRARICKCLWSPGIDFEELISPAYVAWRAGTKNRVVALARQAGNRFLDSLKGLLIRAQALL
jgi:hypothetical protein